MWIPGSVGSHGVHSPTHTTNPTLSKQDKSGTPAKDTHTAIRPDDTTTKPTDTKTHYVTNISNPDTTNHPPTTEDNTPPKHLLRRLRTQGLITQFAKTLAKKKASQPNIKEALRHEDYLKDVLRQHEETPEENRFSPKDTRTIYESLELTR